MTELADALAWAGGHARITGEPEVRERPWATVVRLPSSDGPLWLKIPAPSMAPEVPLYGLLVAHAPRAVLHPVARDEERGLILLPDGGPSAASRVPRGSSAALRAAVSRVPRGRSAALRAAVSRVPRGRSAALRAAVSRVPRGSSAALRAAGDAPADEVIARMHTALPVYAELQRALAPHRVEMIDAGVPDASPAALVARFDEVADRDDPRRDLVVGWAAALADAPGADLVTVDHQDLHPGNVLAGPRFYDWGDAVVAHPFASLLVALGAAARTLGVAPDDPAVDVLRDAYLERFTDLAGHAELVATADLACRAAVVARALTWRRALASAGPDHPFADAARSALATLGASPFRAV